MRISREAVERQAWRFGAIVLVASFAACLNVGLSFAKAGTVAFLSSGPFWVAYGLLQLGDTVRHARQTWRTTLSSSAVCMGVALTWGALTARVIEKMDESARVEFVFWSSLGLVFAIVLVMAASLAIQVRWGRKAGSSRP